MIDIAGVKRLKFKRSNMVTAMLTVITVLILILVPTIVFPALRKDYVGNKLAVSESSFAGLSELWHIESFEGGTGSRASYLTREAVAFEKSNPNAFILVKNKSLEELNAHLEAGERPDIFSFSAGVGEIIKEYLLEYSGMINVAEPYASAGSYDGKQLSLAYSTGGYAIITDPKIKQKSGENCLYGLASFNSPPIKDIPSPINAGTQYQAYERWVAGGGASLLGTQRDLYRCINRATLNKLPEVEYTYIDSYTDLTQFIGISKSCKGTSQTRATKFIEHLTGTKAQGALISVGLVAVDGGVYHSEPIMRDLEKALNSKNIKVVNVFTPQDKILSNRAN